MLIKLAAGRPVVLDQHCRFRWRIHDASSGHAAPYREVARAVRLLRSFIDRDPTLLAYAAARPEEWREARRVFRQRSTNFYLLLWRTAYRRQLTRAEWVRAAFALPFDRWYYGRVLNTLLTGRPRQPNATSRAEPGEGRGERQ